MICDRGGDDCMGEATTTRDTSDGHLPREHVCEPCAAAYDRWLDNYDPPDPDGEPPLGPGEMTTYQRDQLRDAGRLR